MHLSKGRKVIFSCLLILMLVFSAAQATAQNAETQSAESNEHAKKYVAFREDDVAPNAKFAQLEAVNQLTIDKNVPVTLGIVPHPNPLPAGNQLLANSDFLAYMRSIASNHLFQFGQHGYTHQDLGPSNSGPSEFYGRPYVAQYQAIKRGRDDIIQAFGIKPTSFLPPFDKSDSNTLKAAQALGFKEYSTAFADFNVNQGHVGGMKLDTISVELSNQSLQSLENATERWRNDPQSIDTFTVLYHPSDFSSSNGSVNADEVKLLSDYIDYLQGTGRVQFTTLDHSWTTTGNGGVVSSRGEPSPSAATSLPSARFTSAADNLGSEIGGPAAFAVLGAFLVFSLVLVLVARLSKNKNKHRRL
jgi:peptidoglycan/xylan/chitin deacetylase (PgdA/CDA1 family)